MHNPDSLDLHSLRRISSPVLAPKVLYRRELITALNEMVQKPASSDKEVSRWGKLILVCTPSGYGKTTLLADFARQTRLPCCWYFLDQADADKVTFLSLLIASISQHFPQIGRAVSPLLRSVVAATVEKSEGAEPFYGVIDALVNAIIAEIPDHFVLFLCNYHEINTNHMVSQLVNYLLKHLPSQCVLIVESRAIPAFEFASLVSRREVFALNSNRLRFKAQEIRDLAELQGIGLPTQKEAERLEESFDGWIAGILLTTRLGDLQQLRASGAGGFTQALPTMRMDRQHLFAYLVNEVFSREPEIFSFLKQTAILQQMTASMCGALLGITDAEERLTYLEQQGLFVTRLVDGIHEFFTCHSVLRELLCEELRSKHFEQFAALHRRAAELFYASQNYDQAIYHALEAGDTIFAARLIIEVCQRMLTGGHWETLARWINSLPDEVRAGYPQLLVAQANIHLLLDESILALPLLENALEKIERDSTTIDADEKPLLQAEASLAYSKALFQMGQYMRAHDLCQQTMALLPADEVALRAEAYLRLGLCDNFTGNFAAGIAQLQHALQLLGRNTRVRQTALLHSLLAGAYDMIGNYALSEHHRTRAMRCWIDLNDEQGKALNQIGLGVTLQRQGMFSEAEAVLNQALTIAHDTLHFLQGEAYALVSLGDVYQDQGKYDLALSVTEDGLELARQLGDQYLINYTTCSLALTYLLLGDSQTALLLISARNPEVELAETMGYDDVICKLTLGTILLYQRRYSEAELCLTRVEASLNASGLKREQLQANVRLAACYLEQKNMAAAASHLELAKTLATRHNYEHLVQIELQRLPKLGEISQTAPEPLSVGAILPQRAKGQEVEAQSQQAVAPAVSVTVPKQSRLSILALGEPVVSLDGIPITHWRMARAMELFFFLLDNGRPVHKEQIITALWSELNDQVNQTLRSMIYYLRKILGDSCIVYHAGTYVLNLASLYGENIWYDVTAFKKLNAEAQKSFVAQDDGAANTAFQQMVELYRGDYIQSFYSDWCTFRRDELCRIYINARHQLALIAWRREQFDESIMHWQHVLAVDSCLEEAHYGLMRSYLRQGKRGLALRQYQRCLDTLRDELSIQPGPTIQKLYQRLMSNSQVN